jgi:hypothetical protein
MELSLLIAKIFSAVYIVSGIAVLMGSVDFNKIVDEFEKSPALSFISGCVGIIFGVILVNYHNIWVQNWTVLITILSWFMLIGGITVIIFPKCLSYFKGWIKRDKLLGFFMVAFGLLMGYFGFLT